MSNVVNAKINLNFTDQYNRMFEGKQIKNITFIVTHNCNMRCSYCYEHNKSQNKMDLETGKRCIDLLFECDMEEHPYINSTVADGIALDFIGGEPLLEIGLIDNIMDYLLNESLRRNHRWMLNYMMSMSTNGLLVKNENVQKFIRKWAGRLSMSVTVDGNKETHDMCRLDCKGHGTYDIASESMQFVANRFGQNGTKFTIAPGNVDKLFIACKEMIGRYNLRSLHCNCVYEKGWDIHHARTFYHELKKLTNWIIDTGRYKDIVLTIFDPIIGQYISNEDSQNWCGGTGIMLAFDTDGSVLPCTRYSSLSLGENREPFIIGDLENGIGNTKEHKERIALLNSITRQSQSSEKCLNCQIARGCGWCSAYNYEVNGTPDSRVTYICQMHQARVLAASYYWNTIYKKENVEDRFKLSIPKDWALDIVDENEYNMLVELNK